MPTSSQIESSAEPGWLAAVVRGLCPRCRGSAVFRGRIAMHEQCPSCGLKFEREQGYFLGAMYISYAFAVVLITTFFWLVSLVAPQASFETVLVAATVVFLPFVPAVFRYSRVLWMYIDRAIDPA